jgi:hypothetical protein
MLKGPASATKSPFERTADFNYHAETRFLVATKLRLTPGISETTVSAQTSRSVFHERPLQWSDVNWGLIGSFILSAFCWRAIFTFAIPTLTFVLQFLFNRGAA